MVNAMGDYPGASWLEPCHGSGVFVESLSRLGVGKQRIVAIDLDTTTSAADRLAMTFRGVDFLRWSMETEKRFDRIVGNPPFISIKQLPPSLQKSAAAVRDLTDRPVGRGANVWYAFVLASLRLLNKGGSVAFVLPSAAEYANYSKAIRRAIQSTFNSFELYRCNRPLFTGVQEGTLVAVARGYGLRPCMVRRMRFETPEGLTRGLLKSGNRSGRKCPTPIAQTNVAKVTLGEVATIRLGGVTGQASYFLMNEEKREALDLPLRALTPVVSKAMHLRDALLNQDNWDELKLLGHRVWLFNPTERVAHQCSVQKYLKLALSEGGCNRQAYKILIRDPWYRTRLPKEPDAFLSGMSRHGPWLCINNMYGLNATNTLYVVNFQSRNPQDWFMWALGLLTSPAQQQIRRIGRRYAEGLIKFEPGPLSEIELPRLKVREDYESLYVIAVRALLDGDPVLAKEIADTVRV